ncbi:MAG: hypothetical protein KAS23_14650 [Anaerohalosphaera sp.]|nr:hypothetical protein [Anaerohalosphaera sp.]
MARVAITFNHQRLSIIENKFLMHKKYRQKYRRFLLAAIGSNNTKKLPEQFNADLADPAIFFILR